MPADIYFLNHSGFILKIDDIVLVFDYYKDPLQHVEKMITDGRNKIYFFVSHFHGDHFNPSISRFEEYADGYILHRDCDLYLRDAGKMHLMDVGDSYSNEDFTVKMYGSTDAGGSFLIHCYGITIFHAGDLTGGIGQATLMLPIWMPEIIILQNWKNCPGEKWISPCSRWMLDSRWQGSGALKSS